MVRTLASPGFEGDTAQIGKRLAAAAWSNVPVSRSFEKYITLNSYPIFLLTHFLLKLSFYAG
ncbi:MAG: hypothetical protein U9N63_08700, partial [Pseudomonadota bacterium]|nr:hypothetical protein [Pseudomonadota bacterium]